ncbi:MAG: transaldolase [Phycisphaerae bacterium]
MHQRIKQLTELGQSLWYDNIRRGMIDSGELARLRDDGVMGVTSNPTILQKAITQSDDYNAALETLIAAGKDHNQVYEELVTQDIRAAADVFKSVYEQTDRRDGYISLEVNPGLANDTAGTVAEAKRLFERVGRPNVMIKIPGTEPGLPAVRQTIAAGINVNVTLIFSRDVYRRVADAYIGGLEDLRAAGGDLSGLASVASFFVSRVDTKIDPLLQRRIDDGQSKWQHLLGTAANANAKLAYQDFLEIFGGKRFAALADAGARVQRPLWASTSTKNPAYPDTHYVDPLIGPDTVNTVPPATLEAFKDHGQPAATLEQGVDQARRVLGTLSEAGIDLAQVTDELRQEGVDAFARSFDALISDLRTRLAVA